MLSATTAAPPKPPRTALLYKAGPLTLPRNIITKVVNQTASLDAQRLSVAGIDVRPPLFHIDSLQCKHARKLARASAERARARVDAVPLCAEQASWLHSCHGGLHPRMLRILPEEAPRQHATEEKLRHKAHIAPEEEVLRQLDNAIAYGEQSYPVGLVP